MPLLHRQSQLDDSIWDRRSQRRQSLTLARDPDVDREPAVLVSSPRVATQDVRTGIDDREVHERYITTTTTTTITTDSQKSRQSTSDVIGRRKKSSTRRERGAVGDSEGGEVATDTSSSSDPERGVTTRTVVLDVHQVKENRVALLAKYPFLEIVASGSLTISALEIDTIFLRLYAQWMELQPFTTTSEIARARAKLVERDMQDRVLYLELNAAIARDPKRLKASRKSFQRRSVVGLFDSTDSARAGPNDSELTTITTTTTFVSGSTQVPPWAQMAVDELDRDDQLVDMYVALEAMRERSGELSPTKDLEGQIRRRIEELSTQKKAHNEKIFAQLPFLDPMPHGVPLSELNLAGDARFLYLDRQRQGTTTGAVSRLVESQMIDRTMELAEMQRKAQKAYVSVANAKRTSTWTRLAGPFMRNARSSEIVVTRPRSVATATGVNYDDDAQYRALLQQRMAALRAHEYTRLFEVDKLILRRRDELNQGKPRGGDVSAERDAELIRRRAELSEQKESDALRRYELEDQFLTRKHDEAQKQKAHSEQALVDARSREEATRMAKRLMARVQRQQTLEISVVEIELLQKIFDQFDRSYNGVMSRRDFGEFYVLVSPQDAPIRREAYEWFDVCDTHRKQQLDFPDIVRVYREIVRDEIVRRDPKLGPRIPALITRREKGLQPQRPSGGAPRTTGRSGSEASTDDSDTGRTATARPPGVRVGVSDDGGAAFAHGSLVEGGVTTTGASTQRDVPRPPGVRIGVSVDGGADFAHRSLVEGAFTTTGGSTQRDVAHTTAVARGRRGSNSPTDDVMDVTREVCVHDHHDHHHKRRHDRPI